MAMKIGADPEVFLRSKSTGEYVSAFGKFPGTKQAPFRVENGAIQVDGNALEFNIDPAETEEEFIYNIKSVFCQMEEMVAEVDPDLTIVTDPVAKFSRELFDGLPPAAKQLGCEPDFDSEGNTIRPPNITHHPIRTSSFHVHIGFKDRNEDEWSDEAFNERMRVSQAVTPKLLAVAAEWENEESSERRKFYGHSGAFRPKPYGVELRCLDGLCLDSEDRLRKIYRTAVDAMKEMAYA